MKIIIICVSGTSKNRNIGKTITLYQQELFKKTPHLGTFCTQSVNKGLNETVNLKTGKVNLLNTKRNLLYIRNQSEPRSKHFQPRL